MALNVLHTSDWHLGRSLHGRKRNEEFVAFLDWLYDKICELHIDVLLIAGDIFDTTTPSNAAQEMYYHFLYRIMFSSCRHIVVIGGNHDSPSFLEAPKQLLQVLHVHVIGAKGENVDDEILLLEKDGQIEAVVCAVPYLRDRDIRIVEPGETIDEKNAKLVDGIKTHYREVCRRAEEVRQSLLQQSPDSSNCIPLLAMGHLFTAGGKTVEGDGVRELYVGSLAHVGAEIFPACLDYLALGHLHGAQIVGGNEYMRYCGSPLPMGFGEVRQQKKVIFITFAEENQSITELSVPCFQELQTLVGSLDTLLAKIDVLKKAQSRAWLEIVYQGDVFSGNLRERLDEAIAGSSLVICRIKNQRIVERVLQRANQEETLDDLDVYDVFSRCLESMDVDPKLHEDLQASYREIVTAVLEEEKD